MSDEKREKTKNVSKQTFVVFVMGREKGRKLSYVRLDGEVLNYTRLLKKEENWGMCV